MASPKVQRALDALEAAQMYLLVTDQLGMDPRLGDTWEWFISAHPLEGLHFREAVLDLVYSALRFSDV